MNTISMWVKAISTVNKGFLNHLYYYTVSFATDFLVSVS